MRIRPARRIKGQLRVPGDKSISHRAAIIAALAQGTSRVTNFASGADCLTTIQCLRELGVTISGHDETLVIQGAGRNGLKAPAQPLDCGNSGTTMRMLAGALAGHSFSSTLIGDDSLSARPMTRIIEPLEMMGARVRSQSGKAPLTIFGFRPLKALAYTLPVASAQVKSCILLAGLNAIGQTTIRESLAGSRDHTERMLRWFGASVSTQTVNETSVITLDSPAELAGHDVDVPGDISSAAYFVAAAAMLPNSDLLIEEVGLNQTRTAFLTVLKSFGVDIELRNVREECNEPRGNVSVSGPSRPSQSPAVLAGAAISQLIDELPLLAVLGSQTPGGVEIRDAAELRLKESDRITATVNNLRAMGATVEEFADGLLVSPTKLKANRLKSYGDHRIAMAFTIAALLADGESEIEDSDCVGISFPEFFDLLESIVER